MLWIGEYKAMVIETEQEEDGEGLQKFSIYQA
jgi:hypothetical protein